ncbi:unnamed protein product [Orchesella dallaii]|uniref:Uncharacterized protein n=1 Tax=Orchesella dallaii TaxID=48710 RepID=A0ABP1R051_9HEXA
MEHSQGTFVSNSRLANMNYQRKRPVNMDNWKDVKAKTLKNRGMAYESRDGMLNEGKRPPQAGKKCGARCDFEGCDLDEQAKVSIFNQYYEMGSIEIQHTHLAALMSRFQRGRTTRSK